MKKILTTPIKAEDLQDIRVGDVIYLTGTLVTCRDVCHRRLIELKRPIPYDLNGKAIFHAGPIVRKNGDKWEMVSVGPTTSMRMESFEREFIEQTGVKLVVGKGGMGPLTEEGCQKFKALHVIFPAGCAVGVRILVKISGVTGYGIVSKTIVLPYSWKAVDQTPAAGERRIWF